MRMLVAATARVGRQLSTNFRPQHTLVAAEISRLDTATPVQATHSVSPRVLRKRGLGPRREPAFLSGAWAFMRLPMHSCDRRGASIFAQARPARCANSNSPNRTTAQLGAPVERWMTRRCSTPRTRWSGMMELNKLRCCE
jgi:hypothetical protein